MGFDYDSDDLTSSSVLKAEHINDAVDSMQSFVNQGITRTELKDAVAISDPVNPYSKQGFVNSNLVYRPEFYGSPSPRMMAVSGQTHFRENGNSWSDAAIFNAEISGESFTGVPGMCTRLKLRHSAIVNIMCSFYAFEFGGVNESKRDIGSFHGQGSEGYESLEAGFSRIMVNGDAKSWTERTMFTSLVTPRRAVSKGTTKFIIGSKERGEFSHVARGFLFFPMVGRRLHHCVHQLTLSEGVHDVGLAIKPKRVGRSDEIRVLTNQGLSNDPAYAIKEGLRIEESSLPHFPQKKHIFILSRNMVVDAYYLDNDPQ